MPIKPNADLTPINFLFSFITWKTPLLFKTLFRLRFLNFWKKMHDSGMKLKVKKCICDETNLPTPAFSQKFPPPTEPL